MAMVNPPGYQLLVYGVAPLLISGYFSCSHPQVDGEPWATESSLDRYGN